MDINFRILQCVKCGGELDKALMCSGCKSSFRVENNKIFFTENYNKEFKNKYKDPTDKRRWTGWRIENFNFFQENLEGKNKNLAILDLGAGEAHFRELTGRFNSVYTVDFAPYDKVNIIADLNTRLPFLDDSFDIIIASNVLEHIPYPLNLLEECNRILKNGGLILGTVPFLMKVHQKPYDYNRFTYFMLKKLLKDSGFLNINVDILGSPFNTYNSMQSGFFRLLAKTRFSKNYFIHRIRYTATRLAFWVNKLTLALFKPIYKFVIKSSDYAQGYSFKAMKM